MRFAAELWLVEGLVFFFILKGTWEHEALARNCMKCTRSFAAKQPGVVPGGIVDFGGLFLIFWEDFIVFATPLGKKCNPHN